MKHDLVCYYQYGEFLVPVLFYFARDFQSDSVCLKCSKANAPCLHQLLSPGSLRTLDSVSSLTVSIRTVPMPRSGSDWRFLFFPLESPEFTRSGPFPETETVLFYFTLL